MGMGVNRADWLGRVNAATMSLLTSLARGLFDRIAYLAFRMLHRRRIVHGIDVMLSDATADADACVSRLQAALDLLRKIDERRFAVVTRYVRHLIVWPGHYTAYDRWGGVHLAARHLLQAPVELLASALVHEATHLRIANRGIRYRPELRARIEAACVREEAAFLRHVPNLEESWLAELEACLNTPWWEESDRRERINRAFSKAGVPLWLASLVHTVTAPGAVRK